MRRKRLHVNQIYFACHFGQACHKIHTPYLNYEQSESTEASQFNPYPLVILLYRPDDGYKIAETCCLFFVLYVGYSFPLSLM